MSKEKKEFKQSIIDKANNIFFAFIISEFILIILLIFSIVFDYSIWVTPIGIAIFTIFIFYIATIRRLKKLI